MTLKGIIDGYKVLTVCGLPYPFEELQVPDNNGSIVTAIYGQMQSLCMQEQQMNLL